MAKPAKPKPFPKSMAACADLLYDLREQRLAADKVAAELKAREEDLKTHIINNLDKDSSGAFGKHHKVKIESAEKPVVKDWDLFWPWVAKNKAWDCVQKRAGEPAIVARLEAGKAVPGTEIFKYKKVSLTKV